MYEDDENPVAEAIGDLAKAVEGISRGGLSGPGGLEGLAMSIAGENLRRPLGEAIVDAADRLHGPLDRIADAMEAIAYHLKCLAKK